MAFKDFLKSAANAAYSSANDWAQKQQEEYAKWSSRYSNMDKYGLKSEFERHKADILSSPMRKKAFTEACEHNGIPLKRN